MSSSTATGEFAGEVVAEHALVAPGEVSVLDEHYGGPRPVPGRGPRPRTVAEQLFCGLGPAAVEFLIGAAAAGSTRLSGDIDVLLDLHAAHGDEAFLAAVHRAVVFKAEDVGEDDTPGAVLGLTAGVRTAITTVQTAPAHSDTPTKPQLTARSPDFAAALGRDRPARTR